MLNTMQIQTRSKLIAMMFFLLTLGTQGKIKSCPVLYPETDEFSAAKYSVAKKSCWSCPAGYKRSKNPLPDKDSSCKKRNVNKFAKNSEVDAGVLGCKGKDVFKRDWQSPSFDS